EGQEHERQRDTVGRQGRAQVAQSRSRAVGSRLVSEAAEVAKTGAESPKATEVEGAAAAAYLQVGEALAQHVLRTLRGNPWAWRRVGHLDVQPGGPDRHVAAVHGFDRGDRIDGDVGDVEGRHAPAGGSSARATARATTRPASDRKRGNGTWGRRRRGRYLHWRFRRGRRRAGERALVLD